MDFTGPLLGKRRLLFLIFPGVAEVVSPGAPVRGGQRTEGFPRAIPPRTQKTSEKGRECRTAVLHRRSSGRVSPGEALSGRRSGRGSRGPEDGAGDRNRWTTMSGMRDKTPLSPMPMSSNPRSL